MVISITFHRRELFSNSAHHPVELSSVDPPLIYSYDNEIMYAFLNADYVSFIYFFNSSSLLGSDVDGFKE